MICTLTARRLKPGSFDAFRDAFEQAGAEDVPEEIVKRWSRAYVCRDVSDENIALTSVSSTERSRSCARSSARARAALAARPARWRRTSKTSCSTAPTRSSRRSRRKNPRQEAHLERAGFVA